MKTATEQIGVKKSVKRPAATKAPQEYAIVDIETTGGNASGSRITEIAIRIHDGQSVIDQFDTLINPEQFIPPAIWSLTGINNDMVEDAPRFAEVAEKVYGMLNGRIFVAHNVNFDYSFIRHQLEEEGYSWSPVKLCTVRMCRKIRPGFGSYSLGNLCNRLDIPIKNRHRAGGDADATVILFSRLLGWDKEGVIPEMLRKNSGEQQLPPNLPKSDFEQLPSRPGVYYFMDKTGKVLYVGKAINIKKRVASHFTGHSARAQRQHFLRNIHQISYEICATELMALLLECIEIKRLWPPFNRALKRFEPKYGLLMYEDQLGYKRLAVGKLNKFQSCLQVFNREIDGVRALRGLVDRFGLDLRYCRFGLQDLPVFRRVESEADKATSLSTAHKSWTENNPALENNPSEEMRVSEEGHPSEGKGPTEAKDSTQQNDPPKENLRTEESRRTAETRPDPETHNQQVDAALAYLEGQRPTFMILDKGRTPGEKSCIWVEKGNLYAMGYLSEESDLKTPEDIRDSLTRYYGNDYMMQIINAHAAAHPAKVRRYTNLPDRKQPRSTPSEPEGHRQSGSSYGYARSAG